MANQRLSMLVMLLAASLLACSLPAAQASRALHQTDALSNSNGCLATIPKCEAGACATRNVMGVARWVCLRCSGNYEPVVTSDGQDNIVQCVCPKGFYEEASNPTSCTRCAAGAYCPGGDKVENPASRGGNFTCGSGLVTRNTGARSQVDCVAPAGFAMTSPTQATACAAGSYAPAFNRLGKCLRCQSGLDEPLSSGLVDGGRINKRTVCKIPPGRFMSQGLVRMCPQGFYRENWVNFDAAAGTLCLPCAAGVTTDGAGAGLASQCNKVLPGYGISSLDNVTNPITQVPLLPQNSSTGLPAASLCNLGYYSYGPGGVCVVCPRGTVTTTKGAKSVEECVVPPGYSLPAGQNLAACANGTYREGWLMASDPKAANCTSCGDGISSEARDLSDNPMAANGTIVRATPASCYVEAGWGMIAQGANAFIGRVCPINTYGAAGKVYGLMSAPCKPCARNMITDGKSGVSNSDVCVNDDGFGYASEGASRCAPGFYSAKGSRKPCQQCAAGRTTTNVQGQQRLVTDCFVKAGFGVVNSTANSTDAFNPDLSAADNATLAALPVLECPLGYFSAGGSLGSKCVACPVGAATEGTGATDAASCTVCLPGYGKQPASATPSPCTPCAYGSFQQGGQSVCSSCPSTAFYSPVDGNGAAITSTGTTLFLGSKGEEQCVPLRSQLSPEAGQAYFVPGVNNTVVVDAPQTDLALCIGSCPAGKVCLTQHDGKTCRVAALAPADAAAAAGYQLAYKLPPSTIGSASKLQGKMMSSGFYAFGDVPQQQLSNWAAIGSSLGPDARTFVQGAASWVAGSRAECRAKCDSSNVCFGFLFNATSKECLFRGGVDALATRSFFAFPDPSTTTLKW